ncbi:MAG TPA: hypothetical protein VM223_27515 [Planctomycetota bacterium]|nr:hypothetical protein [Planctomycetota bacterium]HUW35376.1 hypothetical protein [Planctomycetota bacterium]
MNRTRLKTLIGILVAVAALLTAIGFLVGGRLKALQKAAPNQDAEGDQRDHL